MVVSHFHKCYFCFVSVIEKFHGNVYINHIFMVNIVTFQKNISMEFFCHVMLRKIPWKCFSQMVSRGHLILFL